MADTTTAALIAEWLGGVMIATFVFVLWRSQLDRNNAIDLSSLILDKVAGKQQVTLAKFGGLLALLCSTWLVVYLALDKSLTDFIFASYVVGWGAVKVSGDVTGKPAAGTVVQTDVHTKTLEQGPPLDGQPPKPVPIQYPG